jgi:hypothetical protein
LALHQPLIEVREGMRAIEIDVWTAHGFTSEIRGPSVYAPLRFPGAAQEHESRAHIRSFSPKRLMGACLVTNPSPAAATQASSPLR